MTTKMKVDILISLWRYLWLTVQKLKHCEKSLKDAALGGFLLVDIRNVFGQAKEMTEEIVKELNDSRLAKVQEQILSLEEEFKVNKNSFEYLDLEVLDQRFLSVQEILLEINGRGC